MTKNCHFNNGFNQIGIHLRKFGSTLVFTNLSPKLLFGISSPVGTIVRIYVVIQPRPPQINHVN